MPYEPNAETQKSLKQELKALQVGCVNTFHVIENAPPETPVIDPQDVTEKTNCYLKGLQAEVHNSNTPISTDDNLLTSEFLIETKEKISHLNELVAYTRGAIHDINAEINGLKNLISTAKEVQLKPKVPKQRVQPEHLQKAKEKFQMMKNEIHSLMQYLFPQCHENIKELMAQLAAAKLDSNLDDYISITEENYELVQQLRDMNIVVVNPYNKLEVKLSY